MLRATCYLLEREALQSLVGVQLCLGQIVENALHLAVLADHAVRVKRGDGDEMRERRWVKRAKKRGESKRWDRMKGEDGQRGGASRGREKRGERREERRETREEMRMRRKEERLSWKL